MNWDTDWSEIYDLLYAGNVIMVIDHKYSEEYLLFFYYGYECNTDDTIPVVIYRTEPDSTNIIDTFGPVGDYARNLCYSINTEWVTFTNLGKPDSVNIILKKDVTQVTPVVFTAEESDYDYTN